MALLLLQYFLLFLLFVAVEIAVDNKSNFSVSLFVFVKSINCCYNYEIVSFVLVMDLKFNCPLCNQGSLVNEGDVASCSNCPLILELSKDYLALEDYIIGSRELHELSCKKPLFCRISNSRYLIYYCVCGFYDCIGFVV